MEHPKSIGDRSTLAIMLALSQAGFVVLTPFGENVRYDLVIDNGTSLARVQCKTGRLRGGGVTFNVCSTYGHHQRPGRARRNYVGEVDLFAVYCPDNAAVYVIPIDHLRAGTQATLRVTPPRNGQRGRIRWARQYLIATIAMATTEEPGVLAGAG